MNISSVINANKDRTDEMLTKHKKYTLLSDSDYLNPDKLRMSMDILPSHNPWNTFNRYYSVYPYLEVDNILQYIFFTRPVLNLCEPFTAGMSTDINFSKSGNFTAPKLLEQASNNPIISYIAHTHGECIYNLIEYGYKHQFIPYFTGRVESIQVPDFQIKYYSLNQPYTGYSLPLGGNGIESTTGSSFSVTFRDDESYRILTTHRALLEYIHCVNFGSMDPKLTENGPIAQNYVDYSMSVYQIAVRAEGHEILWFDKFTGVIPTDLPDNIFSFNRNSRVENKISINYQYFHHRACDPCILRDFNYNAFNGQTPIGVNIMDDYDSSVIGNGNGQAGTPFISVGTGSLQGKFFLEWSPIGDWT